MLHPCSFKDIFLELEHAGALAQAGATRLIVKNSNGLETQQCFLIFLKAHAGEGIGAQCTCKAKGAALRGELPGGRQGSCSRCIESTDEARLPRAVLGDQQTLYPLLTFLRTIGRWDNRARGSHRGAGRSQACPGPIMLVL